MSTAVSLLVMALLPPFPVLVATAAAVGMLYGPVQPVVNLAMQTRAAPRLRGRVIGVLSAAEYAAGPLGYMAAGPAVDAYGVQPAFLVGSKAPQAGQVKP